MANGSPIRLSAALTQSAREAAAVLDRSLTDQVEHWARLGQLVERAVSADTVMQLKARSHDANIPAMLAFADTAAGRAKAAAHIRDANRIRYGVDDAGSMYRVDRKGKKTKVR
jgi:hypothetical protein